MSSMLLIGKCSVLLLISCRAHGCLYPPYHAVTQVISTLQAVQQKWSCYTVSHTGQTCEPTSTWPLSPAIDSISTLLVQQKSQRTNNVDASSVDVSALRECKPLVRGACNPASFTIQVVVAAGGG